MKLFGVLQCVASKVTEAGVTVTFASARASPAGVTVTGAVGAEVSTTV